MTVRVDAADRALIVAQELRAAAEETRQVLGKSRSLVERSRQQTLAAVISVESVPAICADDPGPPQRLVECLIEVYELAEEDGEPRTRALLGNALLHVGRRVAAANDSLQALKVVLH